jgi:hypothetical protein
LLARSKPHTHLRWPKSISCLKSHAAQISDDLQLNGNPFFITQDGDASMEIEGVKEYPEKAVCC